MIRDDYNDQIYKTKDGKGRRSRARSRTGTRPDSRSSSARSRLRSPRCSAELRRSGIEASVLNAKPENAQREGETVAQAGLGAVTIATNMAGRGVDIKLGGDPEQLAGRRAAQARPGPR